MSDLISRQDTLKRLCEKCTEGYEKAVCGVRKCTEYQVIEDMPSADRPTGEWTDDMRCTNCGFQDYDFGIKQVMKCTFCPNCGAKMEDGV